MTAADDRREKWEVIEKKVEAFWADRKALRGDAYISTRALYTAYCDASQNVTLTRTTRGISNNEIGLSKFNKLVTALEKRGPGDPFPLEEWIPWVNSEESAEESDFLLRIKAIKEVEYGIGLYIHEAAWGRRLRVALEGLHPYAQYKIVMAYALRDRVSYHLREERITSDLDSYVVYKPWLPGNLVAYELALASGIVPKLKMNPIKQEREKLGDLLLEPQNFIEEVRLSWRPQILALLNPGGTYVPGCEDDPDKADMLDQILKFWAGATATDVSKLEEEASDERQY